MDDTDEMLDELEDIDYMEAEEARDKAGKHGGKGCCLIPALLILLTPAAIFSLFHFLT